MLKAACIGLVLAAAASSISAQADDFYKGRQINFVLAGEAGDGYDMYARMIARFLPKYIPGEPTIAVQNMPGAGGLRAANWLYGAAPKDGLTIGMVINTTAFEPLYGNKLAQFDAVKFNWLGSPSQETALLIVWHTVPVDKLEDAQTRELVLSASGSASTPAFFARVLSALFDLKVKIIPGYKSQPDSFLAMTQGENDGNASPFWSSLKAGFPDWLTEKKIKPLVYYGARNKEIEAPYALDLLQDAEKRAVMEIAQSGLQMGRPMTAPPGVDAAKINILHVALDAVFKDSGYLAECAKARLNCATPSSGKELEEVIQRVYASPAPAVKRISEIYMEGQR
jgi:tripartite-type tricarboxylate transporter receptor subunit TctC